MAMTGHWHVAGGLAGYGPDGSDGYGTATSGAQLADMLADELRGAADYLHEGAEATAESDKAAAWDVSKEAEAAATLALNFDNKRSEAPLYAGRPDDWDAEVERLAREHFPYYYDHTVGPGDSARLSLYAWRCDAGETCEHVTDED